MGRHATPGYRRPPSAQLPSPGPRRVRDMLSGLGAAVVLLLFLVGVPLALSRAFGWPLPRALPSVRMLQRPVDASVLLRALAVLVWLAWAQFAACVLAEVRAELSGVGLPAAVPGPESSQLLARRLVTATLLLASAAASLAPVSPELAAEPGVGGDVRRGADISAQRMPTPAAATPLAPVLDGHRDVRVPVDERTGRTPGGEHPTAVVRKLYRVNPPEGRHHESLWEIAERHLGDGRRYHEIFEMNKERVQPGGERLHLARLIRPGWILHMPADAVGVEVVRADPERVGGGGEADGGTARHPGTTSSDVGKAHQQQGADGATAQPRQWVPRQAPPSTAPDARVPPGGAAPGSEARGSESPGSELRASPPDPDSDARLPAALAGATLLAAGLLAALGRRRRHQLWHRAFGGRIRRATGAAATAEETLRYVADPAGARLLDLALRALSLSLADLGRPLPSVYAARLHEGGLELLLSPADRDAPPPWQAGPTGATWRLPPTAVVAAISNPRLSDVLAPYPGLVSLGSDAGGRVLVDLEAAGGLVALRGPAASARALLASVAAELATNRWSDHMRVTLVGFGAELCVLAPERLRSVASVADVLAELETRAEEVARALAAAGIDTVLTGRLHGLSGDAWMPHYLLVAAAPTPDEVRRLARLARSGQRSALGFIVAADLPEASWSWEVDAAGRLRVPLLGLDVEAALLPEAEYAAVCALFEAARDLDGVPAGPLNVLPGQPADEMEALAALERPAAVDLRVLGPVDVTAPGVLEEGRRAACTEMLVYLALHPEGVHPIVLAGAVWPRGVSSAQRDSAIARLRDWLGRDATGSPNLVISAEGRLRLGPGVRTDWDVARTLMRLAAADPSAEDGYLDQALALVRGPLLQGHPPSRYAWLAGTDVEDEVPARLADVAHRLVELRLGAGDHHGAVAAARAALAGAPEDELLWRDLLRAVAATGDVPRLRALVAELQGRVEADPAVEELPPETEALIDELLPSWRLSIAR